MPLISTFGSSGSQSFGTRGLRFGGSAEFNALGDRFSFPLSTAFNYGTGNFTIEGWIYPTANNATRVIWRQADNIYFCTINGGQLYWATGNNNFAIAGAPALFAWNHVAVVRNSGFVRIFLNGVGYSSVSSPNLIGTPVATPALGNYQPAGNNQFLGYITNFRIVKQALYTSDFIPSRVPFTRTSQGSTTTSLLMNMSSSSTLAVDSSANNLSITNSSVTYSTLTPYNIPYVTPPTVVVSSATVTPSTLSPSEGNVITVSVTGTNTPNGTYYYSLQEELGTGALTGADFTSGSLTGSFNISGGTGSFPITVTRDLLTEGNEIFTIYVRQTSTSGPIIGTSAEITITDTSLTPVFTITPTSINEGSSASFTVQNVGPDGTYFWTVLNGTSANADFTATSGSFIVSGSSGGADNGTGSFSVPISDDRTTEGSQTFQVQVRSGSTSGTVIITSNSVTINDTSLTPAFTVAPTSINEGTSGSFTVNNLGPAGTYYWTILNGTTGDQDFTAISGSFTTSTTNGSGSFTIPITQDLTVEGSETFQVQIRIGSTSGTVILTSSSITINDVTSIVVDGVTSRDMRTFSPSTVTTQTSGYGGTPYLNFNSSNYTTNTYFEVPVSAGAWVNDSWVLEAVFRMPTTSPADSFASAHTILSICDNANARLGVEYFGNSIVLKDDNGSNGGGTNAYTITPGNWIYLKTYENLSFLDSGLLIHDLTQGIDIVRSTNNGTPNYVYYSGPPTKVTMGGNPVFTGRRAMDADIAFIRVRRNANTANKAFPAMPFVMPTVSSIGADDVFFLIGRNAV